MPNHWFWKKRKQKPALIASGGFAAPRGGISYATAATAVTMQGTPGIYMETPARQVLQDRGLAIEPIVGYRGYHALIVDGEDGLPYLTSFNGVCWPHRKPLNAMCGDNVFADHDAPKDGCQCGIYAWDAKNELQAHSTLWGEVYLWGDVLVCDAGYRAELAYPKTLHIRCAQTRASMRLRDGLAEAYGVPVTLTDPEKKAEEIDVSTFSSTGGLLPPTALYGTNPVFLTTYPPPPTPPAGPSPSA